MPGACFSRVKPTPVLNPVCIASAADALALIDLKASEASRPEFARYFGGCDVLPGSDPAAHCYCGHQFGYFSGQLGDGAAILLGEVVNKAGERWHVQLKGCGKTPFSRTADGRKVLRSSVREFLCSEVNNPRPTLKWFALAPPPHRKRSCLLQPSLRCRRCMHLAFPRLELVVSSPRTR